MEVFAKEFPMRQGSGNGAPEVERPGGFRLGVSCDRVRRVVAQEWQDIESVAPE